VHEAVPQRLRISMPANIMVERTEVLGRGSANPKKSERSENNVVRRKRNIMCLLSAQKASNCRIDYVKGSREDVMN
jgi:hypothetical protein